MTAKVADAAIASSTTAVRRRAAYSLRADLRQLPLELRIINIARLLEVRPSSPCIRLD
jgi:hypothetical protein